MNQPMNITSTHVVGVFTESPAPPLPESAPKTFSAGTVRAALSTNQAGWWASDHRAESEKFTGWDYIALHAKCIAAAQATTSVYDDNALGPTAKAKRANLRKIFGSLAKSQAAENEPAAKSLPEDHRLVKLLKRPSPQQSGALFRYEQVLQLGLTGTCLIVKIPNRLNQTVERYVVPTAIAMPRPPTRDMPRGGYYINPAAANQWATRMDALGFVESYGFTRLLGMTFPAESFIIIRWPHPILKSDGQSPISAAAVWTDTAEMIDRSRHSHLKNGPDPSLVVMGPPDADMTADELTRAATAFNQKYAGPNQTGKAVFTNHATSVTPISTTPRDMVYELGFTQMRDAKLAIHGVPPMAAGIVSPTGREGLYAPLLQFTWLTVQPMLSIIAEEETIQQAPEFGEGLTVEIEAMSIDDPDLIERSIATDISARAITKNEIRAMRGRSPMAGGDEPAGQQQQQPGGFGGRFGQQAGGELDDLAAGADGMGGDGGAASQPPGGEFGGIGRRQWQNNIKAIGDVIAGLQGGKWSEVTAVEMLQSLGLPMERAQRLVDDAKDGAVDKPENNELLNGNGKSLSRLNGHGHNHNRLNGHARGEDDDWMTAAVKLLGGR